MDAAAAHELLGNIHQWAQDIHEQTCLIPEADLDADQLEPYASKGNAQMLFNFLASQYVFLAMATEEAEPLARMLDLLPEGPPSFRWLNFLRHHDELSLERLTEADRQRVMAAFSADPDTHIYGRGSRRHLAPMLEGDRRRMEMAFSLLFALPGTPLIIRGDEIGMGEHLDLPERDAARLPIQWTPEKPNGGFSDAPPESLITPVVADGPFGVESVNVANQRADDSSFLCWVRNLIGIRKQASRWFNQGAPTVEIPAPSVFVLTYASADDSTMLVIAHNLSGSEIRLGLDGISSCLTGTDTRFLHDQSMALGPYGYAWWEQSSAPAFSPQYETVSMESETA
jgi:maltose alpha-D-glucosyltransferase/alpha-amylase